MHPKNYGFRRAKRPSIKAHSGVFGRRSPWRGGTRILVGFAVAALVIGCFSRDPMRIKGSGLPGDDNAGTPATKADPVKATDDSDSNSAATIADNAALDKRWQKRSGELSSTKD